MNNERGVKDRLQRGPSLVAQTYEVRSGKEEEEGREEEWTEYSGVPRSDRKLTRQGEKRKRTERGRRPGHGTAGSHAWGSNSRGRERKGRGIR